MLQPNELQKLFAKIQDGEIVALPVEVVPIDGPAQLRVNKVDQATAHKYAAEMAEGVEFDAIDIFWDGTNIHLADGYHRRAAYGINETPTVPCKLHRGTEEDAIIFAARSDRSRLNYTNEDKRNAVTKIVQLPTHGQKSNREIARICGVSDVFVGKVRNNLTANGLQSTTRTGADGRTYNVSNIGRKTERDRLIQERIQALPLFQALKLYPHRGYIFENNARIWLEEEKNFKEAQEMLARLRAGDGPKPLQLIKRLEAIDIPEPEKWEGCAACKGSLRVGDRSDPCTCKCGFVVRPGEGISADAVRQYYEAQQESIQKVQQLVQS